MITLEPLEIFGAFGAVFLIGMSLGATIKFFRAGSR